jgi:hypothetical protein
MGSQKRTVLCHWGWIVTIPVIGTVAVVGGVGSLIHVIWIKLPRGLGEVQTEKLIVITLLN